MFFVANNIAVFAVAALLSAFAWVWGGARGDLFLSYVPWLSFILFEVMMAFPQRMPYESLPDARLRVWRAIRGDWLTWACVAFLVLLVIPFVNSGIRTLPWCADRIAHLNVVLWFFPTFLAMVATRHSLQRRGKRLLAEFLVWNGVALAALGFLQFFAGANAPFWSDHRPGMVFFASFGYPNMGGDYFSSLTFIAIGLWRRRLTLAEDLDPNRFSSHQLFWRRHYPLIAVVILYFAALNTLSRSAILLATAGTVFLFVLAGMMRLKRLDRVRRVKFSAVLVLLAVSVSLFALMFTPESVRREINTLDTDGVLTRMTGKAEYHTRVAAELIADYPAFGCGGWGYVFLGPEKMPEIAERAVRGGGWYEGTANVHNDYMQFICEYGFVGFSLLLIIVLLAIWPAVRRWRRMANVVRFMKHTGLPWPKGFFCFPPMGIAIYTSAVATLIHAFYDCPLRSPAVLSLFFVQLVMVDGFLPRAPEDE